MPRLIFPGHSDSSVSSGPSHRSSNEYVDTAAVLNQESSSTKGRMVFLSNVPVADIDTFFPREMHAMVQEARENDGWIVDEPFDICGRAIGQLMTLPYTGQEIIYKRSHFLKKELAITRYIAEELKADAIGLGSLMTPVAHGGADVAKYIDDNGWKLRATTGDAGTVAAIADGLRRLGMTPKHRVGVIGPGLIGTWLATHAPKWGNATTLFGLPQHESHMGRLADEVASDPEAPGTLRVTMDLGLLAECDVVVIATSRGDFSPELFTPGTVIMDAAIPRGTTQGPQWRDRGVPVVTNAGQMSVPGARIGLEWGTGSDPSSLTYSPTLYGCAAETAQYALNQYDQHNVGHMDDDMVDRCTQWFQETPGWGHADPMMWDISAFETLVQCGWSWISTNDHAGLSLVGSGAQRSPNCMVRPGTAASSLKPDHIRSTASIQ